MDASCQTDLPEARVPLPLQYPANLIYAQNMLAICMSQMQRVDLNIAQLRFYLREHELHHAAAAVLSGKAHLANVAEFAAVPPVATEAAAGAAVDAGAVGVEADAGAAADGAAEGAGAAPLEHLRVHRRRLAAAVKIAFVMVLLEVRTGWFFVYFFAVFLYIGGIFDPFIEWFQRRPARVTLEQQLTALRNRQRHAESEAVVAATAAAAAAAAGGASADGTTPGADGAPSPATGSASSNGDSGVGGDRASTSTADPAQDGVAAGRAPAQPGDETGGLDAAATPAGEEENAVVQPPQPPWSHRFIYQLFVMFFMTLLPWWNPDPRYL